MIPVIKEPTVGHFKNATDVRRFPSVQEEIGLRCVGVLAIFALEKAQGDERA